MPQSAFEFSQKLHKSGSVEGALRASRRAWEGDEFVRGELADPSARFLFGAEGPMQQPGFAALAAQIFDPAQEGEVP